METTSLETVAFEGGVARGRMRRRIGAGLLAASLTFGGVVAAPVAQAAPEVATQGFPQERVCNILFRVAERFGHIPQARQIILRQLIKFGCISPG